ITIFDRDGTQLTRIPARGANYQFDNPVDLAFDPLGHLFVLDRGRGSIFVFGPGKTELLTSITAGREGRAITLDSAGRLYLFDESAQRIQVYQ
ncbi:MAG: hypothetical protein AB7P22_12505, partial [Vicinamibacterales bacterium]